jgi:hypothetical protein
MKMRIKYVGVTIAVFALISLASMAYATFDWSGTSINSGYALTTDWHGMEVPLGEAVTAWAGTTDLSIEEVKFRWLRHNGTEALMDVVTTYTEEWWEGLYVREFNATRVPDEVGDWGVQGVFYTEPASGHGGGPIPSQSLKTAIRARSFFAVPEVPIGTMAVIIAMFGALSVFALKRKYL